MAKEAKNTDDKDAKTVKLEKASKDKDKKKTSDPEVKKPGKIRKWFKDLKSEIKKVVWPSKKTVINNTTVVMVTVIITSIFVGALDLGLVRLLDFLYNR